MEYLFREGTIADNESFKKLGLNSFGQFRHILTDDNSEKLLAGLNNENLYPDLLSRAKSFVCEIHGEVVGMAFIVHSGNPTQIFQADWCYLRMVGVHTQHGGKGIGKKLTAMCLDQARKSGEKSVALHTSEFMDAARHIYEDLGFQQVKEFTQYGKKYWLYKLEL
jgi:ribosomal protein S18 acetylase RimI-like enzyme